MSCAESNRGKVFHLTSSCVKTRDDLVLKALVLNKPSKLLYSCWMAFMCILRLTQSATNQPCSAYCGGSPCKNIVNNDCPDMLTFPDTGALFGQHFYAYKKEAIQYSATFIPRPNYVCFLHEICSAYPQNKSAFSFNNATCYNASDLL